MKILVLGGGQVGSTVARNLVEHSNNDVTVIDLNEQSLKSLEDNLDVNCLVGNAASPVVLKAAGAYDADLLLALTRSDETNLVACLLAKQVFHIPNVIARVRHGDLVEWEYKRVTKDKEKDKEKEKEKDPEARQEERKKKEERRRLHFLKLFGGSSDDAGDENEDEKTSDEDQKEAKEIIRIKKEREEKELLEKDVARANAAGGPKIGDAAGEVPTMEPIKAQDDSSNASESAAMALKGGESKSSSADEGKSKDESQSESKAEAKEEPKLEPKPAEKETKVEEEEEEKHSLLSLFGAEESICPEQLVQEQFQHLFSYPDALQVLDFVGGEVQMIATRAQEGGGLVGRLLKEIAEVLPEDMKCFVTAIYRNDSIVQLTPNTKIIHGDEIFFIARKRDVPVIMTYLRSDNSPVRKIMIAGGGNIGYRIAKACETKFDIRIIENKESRSEWLAENLDYALVLRGSCTNETLLAKENVDDIDIFCAITDADEDNIMAGLLAKKLGAKRVISVVNRPSYVDLIQGNTIDIVISPHLITIGSILAHIRRGHIVASHPLRRGDSEAIEAVIHGNRKTSKIVGRPNDQIKWPHGCTIAAVIRDDEFIIGNEDFTVQEGDHMIFHVTNRNAVQELEKLIQVKVTFF